MGIKIERHTYIILWYIRPELQQMQSKDSQYQHDWVEIIFNLTKYDKDQIKMSVLDILLNTARIPTGRKHRVYLSKNYISWVFLSTLNVKKY